VFKCINSQVPTAAILVRMVRPSNFVRSVFLYTFPIFIGPSHWSDNYPDCAYTRQSPIDLATEQSEPNTDDNGHFEWTGYDAVSTTREFEVINNGHSGMHIVIGIDHC
jgi:hypothetical protein